ncbi:MAG: sigma-70 family RNA polymerase sigma factor [Candidatus Gribaldobacteria bacterium]|nr:sigma-70 family RNA polymerase sigma factor [Candidatus Gribaldobacteria bacterium]
MDFLRKKKVTPLSFAEELIAEKGDMVENIAQKDILEAFNIASKKLSSKNQKLIALHHQSGLTFSEIAQFLGEPINTIKSRYRRAITTLKKMLVDFQ